MGKTLQYLQKALNGQNPSFISYGTLSKVGIIILKLTKASKKKEQPGSYIRGEKNKWFP